jgi:hypothetical protein
MVVVTGAGTGRMVDERLTGRRNLRPGAGSSLVEEIVALLAREVGESG